MVVRSKDDEQAVEPEAMPRCECPATGIAWTRGWYIYAGRRAWPQRA